MQNTRTNRLETAESLEELRERIPEDDRGPVFSKGAIVTVEDGKGSRYRYRVTGLKKNRLFLKPHGKADSDE